MIDTNEDSMLKGQQLRIQALELLKQAELLDGLKVYPLPEYAPVNSPVFLLWAKEAPSDVVASLVFDARKIDLWAFSLEDVCGVSIVSRLDGPQPKSQAELEQSFQFKAGVYVKEAGQELSERIECLQPGSWQYEAFIAGYNSCEPK